MNLYFVVVGWSIKGTAESTVELAISATEPTEAIKKAIDSVTAAHVGAIVRFLSARYQGVVI